MSQYIIFTDGAYSSLRNQGGVGVVFVKDGKKIYEFSRMIPNTTNNRCEISAVIYALNAISKPIDSVTIYTDSQYVLGCINEGWQRKKNKVLWSIFDNIYNKASKFCQNIKFDWVKGHSKSDDFFSEMNNLADKLAVEASQEYETKKE